MDGRVKPGHDGEASNPVVTEESARLSQRVPQVLSGSSGKDF